MALTAAQQRRFHIAAFEWLRDQIKAGNDRALYQLWKANITQTKTSLTPYLNEDKLSAQATQASLPATDAAQTVIINEVDAILADPNP